MDLIKSLLSSEKRATGLLVALLAAVALSRLATLGAYPLMDDTEARYAEIPRRMAASGDWITPRIDQGEPFWAKPPLSFWAAAVCIQALGANAFTARLSDFLLSAFTVWLIYCAAAQVRGRGFGLLCALILSTTGAFYVLAGTVMTDIALMATVSLSLASFVLALHTKPKGREGPALPMGPMGPMGPMEPTTPSRPMSPIGPIGPMSPARPAGPARGGCLWGYAFFVGLGLSLLAKGPVGPVLIFAAIIPWALWKRQWRAVLRGLPWITGPIVAALVAVPWYWIEETRTPGFLEYFIVGENFKRFLISNWKGDMYGSPHEAPRGTIWLYLLSGSLPWLFLVALGVVQRIRAARRTGRQPILQQETDCQYVPLTKDPWYCYFLLWFLSPALFFTLSRNIMYPYILPALPGLAFLAATELELHARRADRAGAWGFSRRAFWAMAGFTPLVYCLAATPILRRVSADRSQLPLIERFEKNETYARADLLYYRRVPFSAQFYTQGRAGIIPPKDMIALDKALKDGHVTYLVLPINDMKEIPVDMLSQVKEIGRFGKHVLLQEIRPGQRQYVSSPAGPMPARMPVKTRTQ